MDGERSPTELTWTVFLSLLPYILANRGCCVVRCGGLLGTPQRGEARDFNVDASGWHRLTGRNRWGSLSRRCPEALGAKQASCFPGTSLW